MIKQFEKLTKEEWDLLIKAPILVSVLAASYDNEVSSSQKADAIELAHIKSYSADPLLKDYYKEVETNFREHFEEIVKKYAPFDDAKREALKKEISVINKVISKLDKNFALLLHKSLSGYAEHVKHAENNLLVNFIFPIPIHGFIE